MLWATAVAPYSPLHGGKNVLIVALIRARSEYTPRPPLFWFTLHFLLQWPPLWSSGQSSWLQIQTSGFYSRRYQIFCEVVGLEQGPLSLMSTIEELLGRKSSGSGLDSREYGRKDPSRWPRGTRYPWTLALTSPTSGGRSVGIVSSRTKATELCFLLQ
jgi:hypothetical protein